MSQSESYGCLAEFDNPDSFLQAVTKLCESGYSGIEAYSPFPVNGMPELLRSSRPNLIPRLVLIGALFGFFGTLIMQWYASTIAYPMNIGGRPYASWPAFIPAALEMIFLFAVLFGMAGMLIGTRLPQLYHPAFNIEHFAKASDNGFFVLIRADDRQLIKDSQALRDLLAQFAPRSINDVPLK